MKLLSRRKQQIKRYIFQISVISFIVVVIWIGFEIYWSYQTPTQVSKDINLSPLDTNLYIELAQQLNQRTKFSQEELDAFTQSLRQNQRRVLVSTPLPTSTASANLTN